MRKSYRNFQEILAFIFIIAFIIFVLSVVWVGARHFSYDICTAKVHGIIPKNELNILSPPTDEELKEYPHSIKEGDQLTNFYHGVLKCYRDAKSRFYLWY